jgi:hypothetical protein
MNADSGPDQALRELDEAHRARARFYWHAFDELRAEVGAERARPSSGAPRSASATPPAAGCSRNSPGRRLHRSPKRSSP